MTTKFRPDGALGVAATQASIDRLIEHGVSPIGALPMPGENASLSPGERETVLSAAKDTVAAARHMGCWAPEVLMVFPSLAYRIDRRETATRYEDVAAASIQ